MVSALVLRLFYHNDIQPFPFNDAFKEYVADSRRAAKGFGWSRSGRTLSTMVGLYARGSPAPRPEYPGFRHNNGAVEFGFCQHTGVIQSVASSPPSVPPVNKRISGCVSSSPGYHGGSACRRNIAQF